MKNYKKNLKLLENNHVYSTEMEHDACGVGVIASTEGKKSRKIVARIRAASLEPDPAPREAEKMEGNRKFST